MKTNLQTYSILLLMLFMPLPLGGLVIWSKSVFVLIVAILVLVECYARLIGDHSLSSQEKSALVLWLSVTVYICFQVIPAPFLPDSLWCAVCNQQILDSGLLKPRISPHPMDTLHYWAMFTAYWAVLLLVMKLPRKSCFVLIAGIVIIAVFEAIYGLLAFNKGQETIIGVWKKERFFQSVTGTFYNKNHLAILLALGLPIGTSFLLNLRNRRQKAKHLAKSFFDIYTTLSILFVAILGLAILGSDSRLGVLLATFSMLFYVYLRNQISERKMSKFELSLIVAGVLFVLLAGIWVGIGSTVSRFLESSDHVVNRLEIYQTIFKLPASVWLFGIGAGGFEDVYKLVQPETQYFTAYHAHSDPLQFVLEFGLVGTVIFAWLFIRFLRVSGAALPKTDIECAVFSGMMAVILHSIVDFDFQIPGVALMFWVCLGLLLNSGFSSRATKRYKSHKVSLDNAVLKS